MIEIPELSLSKKFLLAKYREDLKGASQEQLLDLFMILFEQYLLKEAIMEELLKEKLFKDIKEQGDVQ